MSEYFIMQKEQCGQCARSVLSPYPLCSDCNGTGYIGTQIDADEWLLDRLKALRFNLDNANYVGLKQLGEVRFED